VAARYFQIMFDISKFRLGSRVTVRNLVT